MSKKDLEEFNARVGKDIDTIQAMIEKANRSYEDEPVAEAGEDNFKSDLVQWQIMGGGRMFSPASATTKSLPPDIYRVQTNPQIGMYLERVNLITDELVRLPDTVGDKIIARIQNFWESRKRYQKFNLLYKRGYLLFGPPGSGKTSTIDILIRDIVDRGGIVIMADSHPRIIASMLQSIRMIEPEKPIICIMEDIDALVAAYGEHEILSILDGEDQIDNIVHIATTNYPERLDPRLVQRPSRFDEIFYVDMPDAGARKFYIEHVLKTAEKNKDIEVEIPKIDKKTIEKWVKDTKGLGYSHLRDLVASVLAQGLDYEDTIERLKLMVPHKSKLPTSESFNQARLGFGADYDD